MDLFWRLAYRAAYRLLRLHWWLIPSTHEGAVIALWWGDRLLLVEMSYHPALSLPGGGIERGEAALAAVRRELREELGLDVPADAIRFACEMTSKCDRHIDHVRVFEARLDAEPVVRIDRREIVRYSFLTAAEALARKKLSGVVRHYLATIGEAG